MLQEMSATIVSKGDNSLAGPPLMDRTVSKYGTVHSFDPKHNIKRFRERDKNHRGVQVSKDGASLNNETLRRLFSVVTPSANLDQLFNPDDK